jgi:hypothetical protein
MEALSGGIAGKINRATVTSLRRMDQVLNAKRAARFRAARAI